MNLCLATAHASIFNILRQAFFRLNQRMKLFCLVRMFYEQTFLVAFYLIILRLSIEILTLEIQSFKRLRYTYEDNN